MAHSKYFKEHIILLYVFVFDKDLNVTSAETRSHWFNIFSEISVRLNIFSPTWLFHSVVPVLSKTNWICSNEVCVWCEEAVTLPHANTVIVHIKIFSNWLKLMWSWKQTDSCWSQTASVHPKINRFGTTAVCTDLFLTARPRPWRPQQKIWTNEGMRSLGLQQPIRSQRPESSGLPDLQHSQKEAPCSGQYWTNPPLHLPAPGGQP